jgi:muconolactone delta-isomerase
MKALAREKSVPGVVESQFTRELLLAEAATDRELHQSNILREMYFSEAEHEAFLILECSGAEKARQHLSQLPLVRAGLIDFEVTPLVPYDGFARLFAMAPGK